MAIGSDPTRLYRGQGIVLVADRNSAGQPTGFIDLGNCPALTISPTIERIEHEESRTGRNFKDAYIERMTQVTGTMTLESTAKENLIRYFYGTTTAVAGATITNEVVNGYKGKEMPLEQINITTFTSLTNAAGTTTYTKDPGTDPNVYISSFDATGDTFTANAHGLANDTRVWISAGTLPTGFSANTNYYVIATAANTFQLSATQGGSAVNASSAGAGIVVTVQYDYKVELGTGVIQFYPGASFTEGDSLRANYTAGASEITYAFTNPNRDVVLLFNGLNTAESDAPVRVKVFKARLDPVQSWSLINQEFNQFEISFECLYDDLQPESTGRFFTEEQLQQS
jgi:hypothetical protein